MESDVFAEKGDGHAAGMQGYATHLGRLCDGR
jgi:hypothetical protein